MGCHRRGWRVWLFHKNETWNHSGGLKQARDHFFITNDRGIGVVTRKLETMDVEPGEYFVVIEGVESDTHKVPSIHEVRVGPVPTPRVTVTVV